MRHGCRTSLIGLGVALLMGGVAWGAAQDALDEAAAALERGRVGFAGDSLGVGVGALDIASDHVYDYTFSSAPTDWLARSGEWNATSRWTCSPQWSWYGGYSPAGVAALWNKRYFEGDITVEMYSAFKMRANREPTYLHPNDVNISLCGDGANLDSGYSFIIGGDDNRWTRIMRGTKTIAETTNPGGLWPIYENAQPETYQWHRKWWSLRARKAGSKLQLFFDERLVLEGTDPSPLTGGRVAVWVLRNDMITPRIKVYAERERQPRPPLPDDDFALAPRTVAAEAQVSLSSTSHPSLQNNFENQLGRWVTRDADQGALLTLAAGGPTGKGHCLRLINRAAGGSFGANILTDRFDARQLSLLRFDYKLAPDAKVNFYLRCGELPYEIIFSGMKTAAPGRRLLGQIADVKADDKWHHAEFDLLGALQARQGLDAAAICGDLWVGNESNEGYLLAGFGGNHWAATWELDNFFLGQAGGAKLLLAMNPKQGVEITGYAVAVDDKADGTAPDKVAVTGNEYSADLTAEGRRYAHVKPQLKDGAWGNTVTYALGVDKAAPKVSDVDPAPEAGLTDGAVRLKLTDPGDSGVDLASLKLALDGKELTFRSPGVEYDPGTFTLSVEAREAGLTLEAGGKVSLALTALKDRVGNGLAAPQQWVFGADLKNDKRAPDLPTVKLGDPYLCDNDFETGVGEWANYGGPEGATLTRDDTTANSGRYSLKLYCNGVNRRFGAYCIQRPFDAAKYRIVRFAYKCDSRLRMDLAVYVNGDWKGIRFTDNDSDLGVIGAVPGVQADGQWRTAAFNLYDMLRADDKVSPTLVVRQFVLADWGWRGNRAGSTYHIDDFQVVPVVSGAGPLKATWASADATGFAGAAFAVDGQPDGAAPETVSASGNEISLDFGALSDAWLHLRVRDKAGNWSPTVSREVLVDGQAPTAQVMGPAAGGKLASSEVRIQLTDAGLAGMDPTSVKLQVAGTSYGMDGQGLRYDLATGQLVWNCEAVYPNPVVFPDHQPVEVALLSAADYAGNKIASLPRWSWEMDYSQDKQPPVPSDIHSTSHPTLMTNTFEDGLGAWKNRDGGNGALVELDTSEAASGKACVKLTQQRAKAHMQATIWDKPYPVERYPIIAFDYKVPPETRLVLNVLVAGNWYAVMLNDAAPGVIGSAPGFTADNTWRHAQFDLMPILRRQIPQGVLVVEQIVVGDRDPMTTPQGAVARFDNLVIGQIGRYAPVLRWRATDTTGIQGYSYALDRDPGTVPDEASEGTAPAKTFDTLQPGIWYFHLRAQDGAGNWGPPATYALLHLKAE